MEKEKLTEELLQSLTLRFPNLSTKSHTIPAIHFNKTVQKPLRNMVFPVTFSAHASSVEPVKLQEKTDLSTRVGFRTEQVVSRSLARLAHTEDEPLFVLFDYILQNYLCFLKEQPGKKKKKERKEQSAGQGSTAEEESASPCPPPTETEHVDDSQYKSSADNTNGTTTASEPSSVANNYEVRDPVSDAGMPASYADQNAVPIPVPEVDQTRDHSTDARMPRCDADQNKPIGMSKSGSGETTDLSTDPKISTSNAGGQTIDPSSSTDTRIPTTGTDLSTNPCTDARTPQTQRVECCRETSKRRRAKLNEDIESCFQWLEEKATNVSPKYIFPTADDFSEPSFHRGEYDALIISRKYGLIVVETKSIRDRSTVPSNQKTESTWTNHAEPSTKTTQVSYDENEQQKTASPFVPSMGNLADDHYRYSIEEEVVQQTARIKGECEQTSRVNEDTLWGDVKKTLPKALKQLKQASLVLNHLMSDLQYPPKVTQILALPYVPRSTLRAILEANEGLLKAMMQCLQTTSLEDTLWRCLCTEETEDNFEQKVDVKDEEECTAWAGRGDVLLSWWRRLTLAISGGSQTQISENAYRLALSRFCGKLSRLEGCSAAECIHLTGLYFGRSILRQEQLEIMQSPEDFVCLTGPPGSGKTLLLGLKAAEWARSGDAVVILCTAGVTWGSLVSWLLHQRVKEALGWKKRACDEHQTQPAATRPDQTAPPRSQWKADSSSLKASDGVPAGKRKVGSRTRSKKKKQSVADNVHLESLSPETNVAEFVRKAMEQYGKPSAGVRFIIDESLPAATEKAQLIRLQKALSQLRLVHEICREIGDRVHEDELLNDVHDGSNFALADHQPYVRSDATGHGPTTERGGLVIVKDCNGLDENGKSLRGQTDDSKKKGEEKTAVQHVQFLLQTMDKRLGLVAIRLASLDFSEETTGLTLVHCPEWHYLVHDALGPVREDLHHMCSRLGPHIVRCIERGKVNADWIKERLEMANMNVLVCMGLMYSVFNSLPFFVNRQVIRTVRESYTAGKNVSVWISCMFSSSLPEGFVMKYLTHCVRCPPAIQEVLSATSKCLQDPPECCYARRGADAECPHPSDGPSIKWIDHAPHMTSATEVSDCRDCARALADYLLDELGIGVGAESDKSLLLEDVVITGSPIHQLHCCFLQELQERGIDMLIENQEMTSPPPYPNKALVMGGAVLLGLEAKIVVYVPEIQRIKLTEKEQRKQSSFPETSQADIVKVNPVLAVTGQTNSTKSSTAASSKNYSDSVEQDASNIPAGRTEKDVVHSESEACHQLQENGLKTDVQDDDVTLIGPDTDTVNGRAFNSSTVTSDYSMQPTAKVIGNNSDESGDKGKGTLHDDRRAPQSDADIDRVHRLEKWNGYYLWQVASRSLSHLIVFHI